MAEKKSRPAAFKAKAAAPGGERRTITTKVLENIPSVPAFPAFPRSSRVPMAVDSKRYTRVLMPHLLLHNS